MMLDPMSAETIQKGFKHGGNFKDIRNPSIDPVLSGMVISFDYLDLISLSPVFNPDSPYGFGVIGGFGNFFAGFLLATQNEKMPESCISPILILSSMFARRKGGASKLKSPLSLSCLIWTQYEM